VRSVTVAVVNYEGAAHLGATLPSVRALEGPVVERLLVDSGSTDGSVERVRREFPEFRVIELGANLGPSAARNRALREAKAPLVLCLDNDVRPAPDCLVRLLAHVGEGVAAVAPRALLDADPGRVHYDGAHFHYAGLLSLPGYYEEVSRLPARPAREVDAAIALALLVDRESVLEAGGFAEEYFILFEDQDLSYRLRARGRRIVSDPEAIVFHRGGTSGFSLRPGTAYSERRVFLHSRNRWLFVMRNYRPRTILVALPGLLLYEAVAAALALSEGHFGAYLRGKREAIAGARRARAARRALERGRVLPDRSLLRGGPLSVTPSVRAGRARSLLFRALEGSLALWWRLARGLAA